METNMIAIPELGDYSQLRERASRLYSRLPTREAISALPDAFRSSILALLIIIAVVFYLLRWLYTVYLSVSMFSTTAFGATGSASKPHPQIFTPPWGLS